MLRTELRSCGHLHFLRDLRQEPARFQPTEELELGSGVHLDAFGQQKLSRVPQTTGAVGTAQREVLYLALVALADRAAVPGGLLTIPRDGRLTDDELLGLAEDEHHGQSEAPRTGRCVAAEPRTQWGVFVLGELDARIDDRPLVPGAQIFSS